MQWTWKTIDSISKLKKEDYCALSIEHVHFNPFLKYEFLAALEHNQCVGQNDKGHTGWHVSHILIYDEQDSLIAFIPSYIKTHSYGEYVFDHSWAHAYQQYGMAYYPKLIFAIPFTPVTGTRLLKRENVDSAEIVKFLANQKQAIADALNVHSLHILFPSEPLSIQLGEQEFHQRLSVQFNWYNNNYQSFDDFLQDLTARRRKSIKKERVGITKQSVKVKKLAGNDIDDQTMDVFYSCYKQTYLKRSGHEGYLTRSFFMNLLERMPENLLLVQANKTCEELSTDIPIAAALFLFDDNGLYGRYWGALEDVSGLHFECCYYQGIEYCIDNNIPYFNPGTQGEHKILRGFKPTICYSNHSMMHEEFDRAVKDFLTRENPHIREYAIQSAQLLPFKHTDP